MRKGSYFHPQHHCKRIYDRISIRIGGIEITHHLSLLVDFSKMVKGEVEFRSIGAWLRIRKPLWFIMPAHATTFNLNGGTSIRCRTVPQLSIIIISHRPQTPIAFQIQTVAVTFGYTAHATALDLNGGTPIRCRTVPQLSIIIPPHRPQTPIAFQIQTV